MIVIIKHVLLFEDPPWEPLLNSKILTHRGGESRIDFYTFALSDFLWDRWPNNKFANDQIPDPCFDFHTNLPSVWTLRINLLSRVGISKNIAYPCFCNIFCRSQIGSRTGDKGTERQSTRIGKLIFHYRCHCPFMDDLSLFLISRTTVVGKPLSFYFTLSGV